MSVEAIVGAWLWNKYGKDLVNALADKTKGQLTSKAKEQWARFEWVQAAEKYRQRMKDLYSTTRMLGKPEPVSLEGIFTDVFLLDRPTALRRSDIEALKVRYAERGSFADDSKRSSALRIVTQEDRLVILGKPGDRQDYLPEVSDLADGRLTIKSRADLYLPERMGQQRLGSTSLYPATVRIPPFRDALAFIKQLSEARRSGDLLRWTR